MRCTGREAHALCQQCFLGYVRSACVPGGAFEAATQNNAHAVSQPGQLPCPSFTAGTCACAALEERSFIGSLGEGLTQYLDARGRAQQAVREAEEAAAAAALRDQQALASPLQAVVGMVEVALREGQVMHCPGCGAACEKNGASRV